MSGKICKLGRFIGTERNPYIILDRLVQAGYLMEDADMESVLAKIVDALVAEKRHEIGYMRMQVGSLLGCRYRPDIDAADAAASFDRVQNTGFLIGEFRAHFHMASALDPFLSEKGRKLRQPYQLFVENAPVGS